MHKNLWCVEDPHPCHPKRIDRDVKATLQSKPKLGILYLIKGAFRQASVEAQMLHQLTI